MPDLDLVLDEIMTAPPSRGKKPACHIDYIRDLTAQDIESLHEVLDGDLEQNLQPIQRLRTQHHKLAQLVAEGVRNEEIAAITGYAIAYIANIKSDPAFKNLVAYYQGQVEGAFVEANVSLHSRLNAVAQLASEELMERLTVEPDKFTNRELNEAVAMGADRTGFGTRTTNFNVNVDLAARLERARGRIGSSVPTHEPVERLESGSPPVLELQPLTSERE